MMQGEIRFEPEADILADGLPADAWTNIGNTRGGRAHMADQRPFNEQEMRKIFEADIQQDSVATGGSSSSSSSSSPGNTGGTNSGAGGLSAPSPRSPTK